MKKFFIGPRHCLLALSDRIGGGSKMKFLINLLDSVYTALENDLRLLAAIGMRVVFERAAELIGVTRTKASQKS